MPFRATRSYCKETQSKASTTCLMHYHGIRHESNSKFEHNELQVFATLEVSM